MLEGMGGKKVSVKSSAWSDGSVTIPFGPLSGGMRLGGFPAAQLQSPQMSV